MFSVKVSPFTLTYSTLLFVDFLVMFNMYVLVSASLFGLLTIILYESVSYFIFCVRVIVPVCDIISSLSLYTLTFARALSGVISIFAVSSASTHPL